MVEARSPLALWQSVRALPEFRRLLELRLVSQFGDGLFAAGLAGGLLFSTERAATPWAIAGSFAVLYLPYSLLGPFAGALLDRWDRRLVLIGANIGRLLMVLVVASLLAASAHDLAILVAALIVNGFTRFVSSGLSAALPHVVPREQVVSMNSVATAAGGAAAFLGAIFMLLPRWLFGANDVGASTIIFIVAVPVAFALWLSWRFPPHLLGPDDSKRAVHGSIVYAVATGWGHGARTVAAVPSVAATLAGLAAHRMVLGINSLLVLVLVRHADVDVPDVAGLGTTALFFAAVGIGQFLAAAVMPVAVARWGRYATANGALAIAAVIQILGSGLQLAVMMVCGFFIGLAGQVVKLCADSAMQLDVDDALRGHVFTVQDALFWIAFILAVTACAAVIPPGGHQPALVLAGAGIYLLGLAAHATLGRSRRQG
ncbi:MFS transporter [Mycobacterium gallinarum]|uniref:MFS transporter n=1 Tax=Mycobacterium gallinarum TaxID=39689 RepID=A0A9W4B5X5_9MYCO|nr:MULTISPECIES: MFS transporter [Mycobacterium]MDV3131403.1 MFS transporter [Mycobacterium sp. 29Ha]BBY94656.1 MFS transporter [Mycobacterium gallinarum]